MASVQPPAGTALTGTRTPNDRVVPDPRLHLAVVPDVDWQLDPGNGFYGDLQFELETWRRVGGEGMLHEATREERIRRAQLLLAPDAWWATSSHQFPHCSRVSGLH